MFFKFDSILVYKTFKLDINYKKVDKKTWIRNVENIWELLI